MIKVVAKFEVKPDKIEEFKKITEEMIEKTRQEAGNNSYALYQGTNNPQILTFIEEWEDHEALNKHMEKDYLKNNLPELEKIATTEPEVSTYKLVK